MGKREPVDETDARFECAGPQGQASVKTNFAQQSYVGAIPAGSTNTETPTRLSWGFFLPDRAGSLVFFGVPAETCGLLLLRHQSGLRLILSLLATSLCVPSARE